MKTSIAFTFLIVITSLEAVASWPQFRGPNATGIADGELSTFSGKARHRRNPVQSITSVAETQRSFLTQN